MLLALLPGLRRQLRAHRYDVLLASYAYPDGCATVLLGRILGVLVVVKCHGSDLNRVTDQPLVRFQLKHVLPRARTVVVVSRHLGDRALQLGVPADRLHVVYNGVDHGRFRPADRLEARQRLSLPVDREIVLSRRPPGGAQGSQGSAAGSPPRSGTRGHGYWPCSWAVDPWLESYGRRLTSHLSGPRDIVVVDAVPHDEVPWWMAAADVLCLPSWNEGMPTSSGRPTLAVARWWLTSVGGIPGGGRLNPARTLVSPRQPAGLADGLAQQLSRPPVAAETIARLAMVPSWEESARALYAVLEAAAR